jgi:hypothetical protein
MSIPRSYSEKYLRGHTDTDLMSKNTDWLNYPFAKLSYLIVVALIFFALHISQLLSHEDTWAALNVIHGVVTFIIFHWVKGNPDFSTQGEYAADTLYEQIDGMTPWTQNKKFLMLVPTVLTYIACHVADYKSIYVITNCGIFFILIIAKIPQMHHVRIFGINSTVGIDTKIEYTPDKKVPTPTAATSRSASKSRGAKRS